MKPEVKAAWTDALRSGRFTQGKYQLKNARGNVCVNGVLCEVAIESGVPLKVAQFHDLDGDPAGYSFDGHGSFPPEAVIEWAGVDKDKTYLFNRMSRLNDGPWGKTFDDLAEVVEEIF